MRRSHHLAVRKALIAPVVALVVAVTTCGGSPEIAAPEADLEGVLSMAVDPSGLLYFTQEDGVWVLDGATVRRAFEGRAERIAFDAVAGRVVMSYDNTVSKFDGSGAHELYAHDREIKELTIGPDGDIWLVDDLSTIARIGPTGALLESWKSVGHALQDIAVTDDETVIVASGNLVWRFDRNSGALVYLGGDGEVPAYDAVATGSGARLDELQIALFPNEHLAPNGDTVVLSTVGALLVIASDGSIDLTASTLRNTASLTLLGANGTVAADGSRFWLAVNYAGRDGSALISLMDGDRVEVVAGRES